MGLCGSFDYEVLIDDVALSWISATQSEVVVSIPTAPTAIQAYVKTSVGSLIVKQNSVVRHQDTFELTILEPDCNSLSLAASTPITAMTVDIGLPDTNGLQTVPTFTDSFNVLDMEFCLPLTYSITLSGQEEDWLLLDGG